MKRRRRDVPPVRQAQDDPNVWLSLGGATGAAPAEAASQ